MIENGDRIAVGLSGGKDSWTLFWFLEERRKRVPIQYELFPIHINPGFDHQGSQVLGAFGRSMGWDIRIEQTDFGVLAHSEANRENPCFLCSRLRRQRLFEIADALGCKKLALGHNKDDLIETFIMNLIYAGNLGSIQPYQPFFGGSITVIRPLSFADEATISRFADTMQWPILDNPCPSAQNSKRSEVKNLLSTLYRRNAKIRGNLFRAMRQLAPNAAQTATGHDQL